MYKTGIKLRWSQNLWDFHKLEQYAAKLVHVN